ncbi:MAG: SprT-like domain-containing protein [Muribaculaceae bacterium]|nr:SprT-like domain-containing protein [Muribaculaceae bacterium]
MIADKDFMKEKFAYFNGKIFSGLLPVPELRVRMARTYRGKFFHRHTPLTDKYTIVLSTSYDLSERELEDVLIHEMIHYHIAYHRIADKSAHGPRFRSLMRQVNTIHGRNIEISHRALPGEIQPRTRVTLKRSFVCVLKMRDGECLITRVPSTRIFEFERVFASQPSIVSRKWYGSFDPAFLFYPASTKPKGYRITSDAAKALEAPSTVEMEFRGKYFQTKKS